MSARRAIGFGASSRATASDVVALVRATCGGIDRGTLLATVDRRAALARAIGAALDLDVVTFAAALLDATDGTSARSEVARSAIGTASVAEAAALLALGPGARLVVARATGRCCTCAVAEAGAAAE